MKTLTDFIAEAQISEASDYFKDVVYRIHNWAYELKDEKEANAFIAAIAEGMNNVAKDKAENDKDNPDNIKATEILMKAAKAMHNLVGSYADND